MLYNADSHVHILVFHSAWPKNLFFQNGLFTEPVWSTITYLKEVP